MKNTLLIIFISFFSINALAQIDAAGDLDEKLSFGLKLGIGSSKIAFKKDKYSDISSNGMGHFSIFLNKPIKEKLAIQAGLSYTDRGFNGVGHNVSNNTVSFTTISNRLFYIEIPVNAVFKISLGKGKVLFGGGPYVANAIGGNLESYTQSQIFNFNGPSIIYETDEKRNLVFGNSYPADYKKFDFGANLLTGYQFKKGWLLNINYSRGIQNILPKYQSNYGEKATNSAFHFCVGYEF